MSCLADWLQRDLAGADSRACCSCVEILKSGKLEPTKGLLDLGEKARSELIQGDNIVMKRTDPSICQMG